MAASDSVILRTLKDTYKKFAQIPVVLSGRILFDQDNILQVNLLERIYLFWVGSEHEFLLGRRFYRMAYSNFLN